MNNVILFRFREAANSFRPALNKMKFIPFIFLVCLFFLPINSLSAQWKQLKVGLPGYIENSSVYYITGRGEDIFASMADSTGKTILYQSYDNGNTWFADTNLHHGFIQSISITNQNVYVITNSGIFESSDNGKDWADINGGVIDTVYPVMLVKSDSNLIVSTQESGKLFLSSDNGTNWKNVGNNLPRIGPLVTSGKYIYAANEGDWTHNNDGIYRSTDNGLTWTQINDTLINISSLAANGSEIIAGRYFPPIPVNERIFPPQGGVFISTDFGQTWMSFTSGLPEHPQVYSVAIYKDTIFAGLESGFNDEKYPGTFYSSTLNRTNWTNAWQGGLPNISITTIYANDSSVFVGTIGAGIWRIPLSEITDVKHQRSFILLSSFRLDQNYPNPFNPKTTIEYSLPKKSKVILEIYDILGRKVATLVNKNESAGMHTVYFNAGKLASGIYFYRIKAGGHISTKKMLLLK